VHAVVTTGDTTALAPIVVLMRMRPAGPPPLPAYPSP